MNGGWSATPPAQRAALCLVDSGFDPTAPDVPSGVLASTIAGISTTTPAVGGDGLPVMHGTWMIQATAAPQDGAGMVGPTPGVAILFVRALRDRVGYFDGGDYAAGMLQCDRAARLAGWRLASIALALGGEGASSEERDSVAQRVENLPAVVVAAVGNRAGVPQFPAAAEGVLGVTSVSSLTGERCAGSANADPEAGGLVGPGCFDTMPIGGQARPVYSSGTSGASVMVAAAIAQTCDLAPQLTPNECLQVVQQTARPVPGGAVPDLRAAALAVGVVAPQVVLPLATVSDPVDAAAPATSGAQNLVLPPVWFGERRRPKIRRAARGRVTVTSPDRTRHARLWTDLRGAGVGRQRAVTGRPRGRTVRIRVTERREGQTFERSWRLRVPKSSQ